jgi:hypothetical protein
MLSSVQHVNNLDNLRRLVYDILCHHNQFELGAFRMTERILVRSGSPCGIFFCVHGPRSVKITAIWETQGNTVLFYSSTGERFCKIQLAKAPKLEACAA